MAQCFQAQGSHVSLLQLDLNFETCSDRVSDKHSTFSTTFPIYILERTTRDVPVPPPQSPKADGDPDEFEDDLETDDQSEREVKTKYEWVEEWVRVNDKAPIWMRWVFPLRQKTRKRIID